MSMKEFAIGFANNAFLIVQYEEEKTEDEIFYTGKGYLSEDEVNFRKRSKTCQIFRSCRIKFRFLQIIAS